MGRTDTITKKYMSDNKKFADVFNYFIYGGKQVITPDNLVEKDAAELGVLNNNGIYAKQKYRDILKRCIIKKTIVIHIYYWDLKIRQKLIM